MAEPTPEQIAMARRIAEETRIDGPLGLGPPNAVKAALAAIIETQRLDAALVENWNRHPATGEPHETSANIATAIREGKHYGKDER